MKFRVFLCEADSPNFRTYASAGNGLVDTQEELDFAANAARQALDPFDYDEFLAYLEVRYKAIPTPVVPEVVNSVPTESVIPEPEIEEALEFEDELFEDEELTPIVNWGDLQRMRERCQADGQRYRLKTRPGELRLTISGPEGVRSYRVSAESTLSTIESMQILSALSAMIRSKDVRKQDLPNMVTARNLVRKQASTALPD